MGVSLESRITGIQVARHSDPPVLGCMSEEMNHKTIRIIRNKQECQCWLTYAIPSAVLTKTGTAGILEFRWRITTSI